MTTLLLSRRDVRSLLTMEETLHTVERAYRSHGEGNVQIPAKTFLDISQADADGSFVAMPAYLADLGTAGIKFVGTFPRNPERHRLPYITATLILSDPQTGLTLAIMDGAEITAARTGAAAAVAARCLQPDTRVLAVIGVGRVGCAAVEAFDLAFSNAEIRLYDISATTIEKALARFRNVVKARIHVAATAVDCVKNADVVVTATHSDEALFHEKDVPPGTLIIPLGSSRELDPTSILRASYLVVDHLEQSKRRALLRQHFAAGRLTDSDIYAEIGAILSGKRPRPDAGEGVGIAVLTGMGSLDVAVGHMIFTKARDHGIGVEFDFQSKREQRP